MAGKTAENIKEALEIKYSKQIADAFNSYIVEQAFEEDTLIDDIEEVEPDDLSNCSTVSHLAETYPDIFSDDANQKELFLVLKNALKGILPGKPVRKLVDPASISWGVSRQQSKAATHFITTHCPKLIENKDKKDKAMMDVLAIGNKNDIPLLNWLADTYSRDKMNRVYQNKKDLDISTWMKQYPFFKSLQENNKLAPLEKLSSSMQSFFHRMFNEVNVSVQSMSIINDDLSEFVNYMIGINEAIDHLTKRNKVVPMQIDVWIIPQNVESSMAMQSSYDEEDEDEKEEESDFEEIGVDCIGNIEYRLTENEFKYQKITVDKATRVPMNIKRAVVPQIESMLEKQRQKRIMIYIDRRNPKYVVSKDKCQAYVESNYGQNAASVDDKEETLASQMRKNRKLDTEKTWEDTVYFVEAKDKLFNTLPARHCPETSFWASTQCILPGLKNEKANDDGWGCRNSFNGYQFMLSWHCDAEDLIRCYWFVNCGGTRFFPYDAAIAWPRFFADKFSDKKNEVKKEQIEMLKARQQCQDNGFQNWFELTTKSNLVVV